MAWHHYCWRFGIHSLLHFVCGPAHFKFKKTIYMNPERMISVLRILQITCMWYACPSRSSLLLCMLSDSAQSTTVLFSPPVSHPSPPWWATRLAGVCVIWISISPSVYHADSWDAASQNSGFISLLLFLRLPPCWLFSLCSSKLAACNHIMIRNYIHSNRHGNVCGL